MKDRQPPGVEQPHWSNVSFGFYVDWN